MPWSSRRCPDRFGKLNLRKGLDSLAALVQNQLSGNPFSGDVYIFRGRRGDKVKLLWYSGDGVCLFYKRLSDGKFIWPQVQNGTVPLSPAQLAMLLEGIEWRRPKRTGKARRILIGRIQLGRKYNSAIQQTSCTSRMLRV